MAEPKAKFCACDRENIMPGVAVYVQSPGILTTVWEHRSLKFPQSIGTISASGALELNSEAEKILKAGQ